jgi:hypothetical protein
MPDGFWMSPQDRNTFNELVKRERSRIYQTRPERRHQILGSGAPDIISGKLDGALAAGGSATLSVWTLDSGYTDWVSHSSDSTTNETVYAPSVLRTGTIASGKWVEAIRKADGRYWVLWAEC